MTALEVECQTFSGGRKLIPRYKLRFRPSAYAIILHEERLLVVENQWADKYALPGGSIELGERIATTLKREVEEEAGIKIQVERFLHFDEAFFYFDPCYEAYHGLFFYYLCTPRTYQLRTGWHEGDIEGNPKWVDIADLRAEMFFNGETIMKLIAELQDM